MDLWRPVTAIRLGDADGNNATVGDPSWTPLSNAPAHPSYISTLAIGSNTRRFTGLDAAATDAANSRIWGGIHFRFDSNAGLQLGQGIAAVGLQNPAFAAVPEPATWGMMIAGFGLIGGGIRRSRSRVTLRLRTA